MSYNYKNRRTGNIKVKDKLLKTLSEECSSPKELIRAVMCLKDMSSADLGKIIGKTESNINMALYKGIGLGPDMLYDLTVGLDINPTIVFRCWADWKLKCIQEARANKVNNNQTTI